MISARDEGSVRVVTLTRPPGNTLSLEALAGLRAEVARASADAKVRALVLASGVPKYFSSGLDIQQIMALPDERHPEAFTALLTLYRELLGCPKPRARRRQASSPEHSISTTVTRVPATHALSAHVVCAAEVCCD